MNKKTPYRLTQLQKDLLNQQRPEPTGLNIEEKEKFIHDSKKAEESEDRLRKHRMSQAGCSDCRAERQGYRGCVPVKSRDLLLTLYSEEQRESRL